MSGRIGVPYPRLKEREQWRAADANRLAAEVFDISADFPPVDFEEVADLAQEVRFLARIVARATPLVSGQSPAYSWVAVDDNTTTAATQHPLSFRGDPDHYPAYEESANPFVPIDGTAIVELRPGTGGAGYMLFSYPTRPRFARITGNGLLSGNYVYSWVEIYPTGDFNAWSDVPGGLSGTTTVNEAYEINDVEGVPVGTRVRIWQGYLSGGAPIVRVRRPQAGDGNTVREQHSIVTENLAGGTYTLTFEGQTTSALAHSANAATIEAALEALSNLTNVTVTGTGTSADPFVVEYQDNFNSHDVLTPDLAAIKNSQDWLFERIFGDTITVTNIDVTNIDAITITVVDITVTDVAIFEGDVFFEGDIWIGGVQFFAGVSVRLSSQGTVYGPRPRLNLIASGGGITISAADDPTNSEIDVTFTVAVSGAPQWVKITKAFTDFATASTSNNIEIYSLPAKGVIHGAVIKHTAAFTGGTITDYTLSVGFSSSPNEFTSNLQAFNGPSDTGFEPNQPDNRIPKPMNFGAATSIRAYAVSGGGNLDQATAGSVDIYLLVSALP